MASPVSRSSNVTVRGKVNIPIGSKTVGAGDAVAWVTKNLLGLRPCSTCSKRQSKLNRMLSFGPGSG